MAVHWDIPWEPPEHPIDTPLLVPLWRQDGHTKLPERFEVKDADGEGWILVHFDQVTHDVIAVHLRWIVTDLSSIGGITFVTAALWHAQGVTCHPCITGEFG